MSLSQDVARRDWQGGDSWFVTNAELHQRQVALLDHLAIEMRLRTGFVVTRVDLIRAIIEAATSSGLDLSDASSEEEIVEMILDVARNNCKTRGG